MISLQDCTQQCKVFLSFLPLFFLRRAAPPICGAVPPPAAVFSLRRAAPPLRAKRAVMGGRRGGAEKGKWKGRAAAGQATRRNGRAAQEREAGGTGRKRRAAAGQAAGRDGKGGRAGGTGQKPAGGVPGARADETDGRRGVTEKGEMEKSSGDRHGSGRDRKSRRGSRRAGHAGGRWRAAGRDTRGAGRISPPGSCAGWKAATGRGRSCAGTRRTTRPTGGCPRWR